MYLRVSKNTSMLIVLVSFVFTLFPAKTWADIAKVYRFPVQFDELKQLVPTDLPTKRFYRDDSPYSFVHQIGQSQLPKRPLLIIHGGCWSNAYGVDHSLPMATALSGMGLSVWTAEYRRVGDEGGGWPGSLEDIKSAIHYVTQNTGESALLVGHSAGGHLALKAAEDPNLSIRGVVALAPITDLVSYGAETGSCQSMVPKFMGDDSYDPSDAYRVASVRIEDISVPVIVVIGDADPIVAPTQVESFSSEQLRTIPEAGHFDLIHPETIAFEVVKSIVEQLLEETISGPEEARDE